MRECFANVAGEAFYVKIFVAFGQGLVLAAEKTTYGVDNIQTGQLVFWFALERNRTFNFLFFCFVLLI